MMIRNTISAAVLFVATTISAVVNASPNHPHFDHNGNIARGIHGESQSDNWSGYAITSGAPYTQASHEWIVGPDTAAPQQDNYQYDARWVGIDGFNTGTIIQLGTLCQVSIGVDSSFCFPWYEEYPLNSVQQLNYPVSIGDDMTASIICTANCQPNLVQTWSLTMTDKTQKWTWGPMAFAFQTSMASAESILEAPASGQVLPLANFTKANFGAFLVNNTNPQLTLAANGIIMVNALGGTSNPAAPIGGNNFSTCYGAGTTLTPCATTLIGSGPPPPPPPPPPPNKLLVETLVANPTTVMFGGFSTLTWTSSNAVSCSLAGGFPPVFGSGTSGSTMVRPFQTTTYTLTCQNNAGQSSKSVTVSSGF